MNTILRSALPLLLPLDLLATRSAPPPPSADPSTADGTCVWTLTWDDSLDEELDTLDKACAVELTAIGGALNGRFLGPVAGSERRALFTGEWIDGPDPVLLLQQREPGYTCTYQLSRDRRDRWSWGDPVHLVGTWRDTRGGRGTVELLRAPRPR